DFSGQVASPCIRGEPSRSGANHCTVGGAVGTGMPLWCLTPRVSVVRPSFGSCPQQMIGSTSRMQGKEASEQETKVKSSVGIDISKCWLDAHVLPGNDRLHVANNCAGIRQLKRWLSHYRVALVAIEATGKWHRHLH